MSEAKSKPLAAKRIQVGLSAETFGFLEEEAKRTATPVSNLASIYISDQIAEIKKRRAT